MKLLVVSHSCAEPTNQRLIAEIQAITGWEVSVVLPASWRDEFGNTLDKPPHPALAARAHKIPVLANGNIILHLYRLGWGGFLRREKFDAIYVNHEPYALATAQVCLANLRQHAPSAFGFYSCQNILKSYPPPFSWLERRVYRSSAFAFPITRPVADVLAAKGFAGESTIAALPFDPAAYYPRGQPEDEGLIPRAPGEVVIGYVGRLVESKGLATLAGALARIADLPWKLVVVGTGDFGPRFRELLAADGLSDRVEFPGYIPHEETPRYLSAFDFLVLPSETQPNWKEQFGRVITESLACGRPVVGSDSGEIPNLIRSSRGGLVFAEKNITACADALRAFIVDRPAREEAATRGTRWAKENVSLRAVAEKMAATIARAIEHNRSTHAP